jgi:hypothetical protein
VPGGEAHLGTRRVVQSCARAAFIERRKRRVVGPVTFVRWRNIARGRSPRKLADAGRLGQIGKARTARAKSSDPRRSETSERYRLAASGPGERPGVTPRLCSKWRESAARLSRKCVTGRASSMRPSAEHLARLLPARVALHHDAEIPRLLERLAGPQRTLDRHHAAAVEPSGRTRRSSGRRAVDPDRAA